MLPDSTTTADPAPETACLNCQARFRGSFCPSCGQAASTRRLKLGEIFRDAVSHLFDLDGKALHTVKSLTRNPGRTCLDFVEGKRAGYVPPLRYFLVVIAASILINLLSGFDPAALTANDSLTHRQAQVQALVGAFAVRHLDLAMLLAVPVFVQVVRLLFRGSRFTYAEVGVLVLYVLGQAFLFGLLLTPFKWLTLAVAIGGKVLLQVGLFSWATRVFFEANVWVCVAKSVLAIAVLYLLISLSVLILVLPGLVAII